MTGFAVLLQLQEHDTTLDQLRHRRAHLAERAELAEAERRLAALHQKRADAGARQAEVAVREAALDERVSAIDHRVTDIEKRMYSGLVSATRDLLAMQSEVDSLKTRRAGMEDAVLEVMEQSESLVGEIAALEAERASLEAEAAQKRSALASAEAAVDEEVAQVTDARAGLSAGLAPDLLGTYETLRSKLGGVGAARLVGPSCMGCHLTLPTSEVARIKREPPDTLVLCDQCGRILVR